MAENVKSLELAEEGLSSHQHRVAEFVYFGYPSRFYIENTVEKEG